MEELKNRNAKESEQAEKEFDGGRFLLDRLCPWCNANTRFTVLQEVPPIEGPFDTSYFVECPECGKQFEVWVKPMECLPVCPNSDYRVSLTK